MSEVTLRDPGRLKAERRGLVSARRDAWNLLPCTGRGDVDTSPVLSCLYIVPWQSQLSRALVGLARVLCEVQPVF